MSKSIYVIMTEVNLKLEKFGMVVNPKDVEKLDTMAKQKEVSRSYLIRLAIKKYLEENATNTN